jgi:hypothetical protein
VDDIEDRAQRDVPVEEVTQQFEDAAQRTVADQYQAKNELA